MSVASSTALKKSVPGKCPSKAPLLQFNRIGKRSTEDSIRFEESGERAPTPDSGLLTTEPTETISANGKMPPFAQYLMYYAQEIAANWEFYELQAEYESKYETKVFREANCKAIKKFLDDPKYEPIDMQPLGPHKVIITRKPKVDHLLAQTLENPPLPPMTYEEFEATLNPPTTNPTEPTSSTLFRG